MKVRECMSLNICCCKPDEAVSDVAKKMNEYHVGSMPVCDDNKNVVGIITDRDITLRCVACGKDVKSTPISDVMTSSVCCCGCDTDVQEATKLMSDMQVRRIPVLDNDKVVGMLTLRRFSKQQKCICKRSFRYSRTYMQMWM